MVLWGHTFALRCQAAIDERLAAIAIGGWQFWRFRATSSLLRYRGRSAMGGRSRRLSDLAACGGLAAGDL